MSEPPITLTPEERLALRIVASLAARLGAPGAEVAVTPDCLAPKPSEVPTSALPDSDLLTITEAAALIKMSPRWLYRHARNLPFTRRISRKALRFSRSGLDRWLAVRRT